MTVRFGHCTDGDERQHPVSELGTQKAVYRQYPKTLQN